MPKFKILQTGTVKSPPKLPEYFLDSTEENAEKLFLEFSNIVNVIVRNYHSSTGLDKADLFGEAMLGLAKAKQDFDIERSKDFKTFAIIKIKEALNEYVRSFSATIILPSYVSKAIKYYKKIVEELTLLDVGLEINDVLKENFLFKNEEINRCLELFKNAAYRAKIAPEELVNRIELFPIEGEYEEQAVSTEDRLQNFIVLTQLKKYMDDDEINILNELSKDKSYKEIGQSLGKSDAWVAGKLKKLRAKFMEKEL